jgi:molecular chaperone HscB
MDFLMQQMEWREQLEDAKAAKDIAAMDKLLSELRSEAKALERELAGLFDDKKDYVSATEVTRKLIFIDKVCADIQQAIEYLD